MALQRARDVAFRSTRVVLPDGVRAASVQVRDGRIVEVAARAVAGAHDLGDRVLMPGLVDTHVHVNEPGRSHWEGFESATRAAAAGGVTTLVDMPLNSVPATTTSEALEAKRVAAAGRCQVDVGFWGGVVPGNTDQLPGLWAAGVLGFKCFMVPSGVEEFGHVGEAELREAMPVLARLGAPLLVHAESPDPIERAARRVAGLDPAAYDAYLASRPEAAEVEAVRLLVRLCREHGTRVHVVHVAAPAVVDLLRAARAEGLPITAETCPHYLFFAAEEIPDRATEYKCAPPIRGRAAREALWEGLLQGDLDLVATDHSPCPPEMKGLDVGDFFSAWGGIASLQLGLAATWDAGRPRGCTPAELARWMSAAPARLAGLSGRKGAIAPGHDADLVVWDPDAEWVVHPGALYHRHPVTPYANRLLSGGVVATYVRGVKVYETGRFPAGPVGRLLTRDAL